MHDADVAEANEKIGSHPGEDPSAAERTRYTSGRSLFKDTSGVSLLDLSSPRRGASGCASLAPTHRLNSRRLDTSSRAPAWSARGYGENPDGKQQESGATALLSSSHARWPPWPPPLANPGCSSAMRAISPIIAAIRSQPDIEIRSGQLVHDACDSSRFTASSKPYDRIRRVRASRRSRRHWDRHRDANPRLGSPAIRISSPHYRTGESEPGCLVVVRDSS